MGSELPTFWDKLSVPSSRVKYSSCIAWSLKMETICCLEMSVTTYQPTRRRISEELKSSTTPWRKAGNLSADSLLVAELELTLLAKGRTINRWNGEQN